MAAVHRDRIERDDPFIIFIDMDKMISTTRIQLDEPGFAIYDGLRFSHAITTLLIMLE